MKQNLNFFLALTKANAILSRRLSGHGLDLSDFIILYYLNQGKLRRIDLANHLGLTASGITRMLLPLEKLGIIQRDLDDNDARARYASLTRAGQTLFKDALTTINNKIEDIVPEHQTKKMLELTELLEALGS
jgi:DNA-binding MarR family transcriptional regulator